MFRKKKKRVLEMDGGDGSKNENVLQKHGSDSNFYIIFVQLKISCILQCLREDKDHASRNVRPPVDNFPLIGSNWKGVRLKVGSKAH